MIVGLKLTILVAKNSLITPQINQQPGDADRRIQADDGVRNHQRDSDPLANRRDSIHRHNAALNLLTQDHLKP